MRRSDFHSLGSIPSSNLEVSSFRLKTCQSGSLRARRRALVKRLDARNKQTINEKRKHTHGHHGDSSESLEASSGASAFDAEERHESAHAHSRFFLVKPSERDQRSFPLFARMNRLSQGAKRLRFPELGITENRRGAVAERPYTMCIAHRSSPTKSDRA